MSPCLARHEDKGKKGLLRSCSTLASQKGVAGSQCLACAIVGMEWEAGLGVNLPLPLGCSQK